MPPAYGVSAGPGPSPPLAQLAAMAASAPDLLAAAADPAVTYILVRAHLALAGASAVVSGQARALVVEGDAAACSQLPPSAQAAGAGTSWAPPGACWLDADWQSRHFEARPQTRVALPGCLVASHSGTAIVPPLPVQQQRRPARLAGGRSLWRVTSQAHTAVRAEGARSVESVLFRPGPRVGTVVA